MGWKHKWRGAKARSLRRPSSTAPQPPGRVLYAVAGSGSWVVPPNVFKIWATAVGAGAGGAAEASGGTEPTDGTMSFLKRGVTTLVQANPGLASTNGDNNPGGVGGTGGVGGQGFPGGRGGSGTGSGDRGGMGGGNKHAAGGNPNNANNPPGNTGSGPGAGGAGGPSAGADGAGAGGGGGEVREKVELAVTPGESLDYQVGAGGNAGDAAGTGDGADGNDGMILIEH